MDSEVVAAQSRELIPKAIYQLEAVLKQFPQHEPPVRHYFAKGVYCREMFLAKDAVCVGKKHKQSHVLMLLSGEIELVSHIEPQRIKAPFVMECPAFTKRAFYAHEDSVIVTSHGTDETDLAKIEALLIEEET